MAKIKPRGGIGNVQYVARDKYIDGILDRWVKGCREAITEYYKMTDGVYILPRKIAHAIRDNVLEKYDVGYEIRGEDLILEDITFKAEYLAFGKRIPGKPRLERLR